MKKGLVQITLLTLITCSFWWLTTLGSQSPFAFALVRLLGALSLTGFTYTFYLASRHRLIDDYWAGLDKAYIIHRAIGIAAVLLTIVHLIVLVMARISLNSAVLLKNTWGFPSLILFVLLAVLAVYAKKIEYEKWKLLHKLMIVPFAIGVFHYYYASRSPFVLNAFNLWMHLINLAGLAFAFYIVFLYDKLAFPYHYKVISVKHLSDKTIELTGEASNKHLKYRAGQFTFIKVALDNEIIPSRPFTISNAFTDNIIQFTIKNLGDHTARLIEKVKVGDSFYVSQAHGVFDYRQGDDKQLWIAGGVGIAPFRSFWQTGIDNNFEVDLFYAFYENDSLYLDELSKLATKNLKVHLLNSDKDGFLTVEKIQEVTGIQEKVTVYFCGPEAMRESILAGFEKQGIDVKLHYEEFDFRS